MISLSVSFAVFGLTRQTRRPRHGSGQRGAGHGGNALRHAPRPARHLARPSTPATRISAGGTEPATRTSADRAGKPGQPDDQVVSDGYRSRLLAHAGRCSRRAWRLRHRPCPRRTRRSSSRPPGPGTQTACWPVAITRAAALPGESVAGRPRDECSIAARPPARFRANTALPADPARLFPHWRRSTPLAGPEREGPRQIRAPTPGQAPRRGSPLAVGRQAGAGPPVRHERVWAHLGHPSGPVSDEPR